MAVASGPIRLEPVAVAAPRDAEDLALLVSWAAREGCSLLARGAGTGMPGGNVGPGICVDLSGWKELGAVDVEARRVTTGPGVIAADLESAAVAVGLSLPPLPSSATRCTVGGMVANNAAGVRSFGHGATHTWVDAADVILADGTPATLTRGGPLPDVLRRAHVAAVNALGEEPTDWPDVRKNASGYALDRFLPSADALDLLVGSEGTLALITRVRFRLDPVPPDRALALLPVPDLSDLAEAIATATRAGAATCEFFAARFLDVSGLRDHTELGPLVADAAALLLVEIEGDAEALEEGLRELRCFADALGVGTAEARSPSERARLWEVRHAASPVIAARTGDGLVSMQFIEDSVVRPDRLAAYLLGLGEILAREETDAVMFGHAGDGNVHVNPLIDARRPDWRERARRILEATVDLVAGLGGTLSGEHGDGRIRAPYHARIFGERTAGAFRTVKEILDPAGILNPGVVIPLPGQDPLWGLSPEPGRR